MNIPTCFGCYLRNYGGERCPILETKLAAVRGAGLTSIKFRCTVRPGLFKPGERVKFTVMEIGSNEYGNMDYEPMTFTGWVWKTVDRKVYVVSSDTDKPVLKFYPNQLKRVEGGGKRCCIHCRKPEGVFDIIKTKHDPEPRKYECRGHSERTGTWEESWVADPCEYEPREAAEGGA